MHEVLNSRVVGLFKQGGTGDPVLNAAWANFQALKFSDAAVQQQHSAMTRRQYTRTVKCWLARAHGGWGNCATKRKRTQLLSEAEKIDAATILATPGTQRMDGADPAGLVGTEVQEWWKWVLLPACKRAAELYFNSATNPLWTDEDTKLYKQLMKMVGWNAREWGAFFMLLGDKDVRHTWLSHAIYRLHGQEVDRSTLPPTHSLYIRFKRDVQEAPSAPKVPDTIQQPIELCYSHVKPDVKKRKVAFMRQHGRQPTGYELADMTVTSCKAKITPALTQANFRHAETSINVFKGHPGQSVQYVKCTKPWTVQCTDGGWVPKIVAA